MAPPRSFEPGSPAAAGAAADAAYDGVVAEMAAVQGVINVAGARLVALTATAIELGISGGDELTPRQWVARQLGASPGRAHDIVKLAERTSEIPHTIGALAAGELSLDQAAEVARYVPARYDESAARVAACCTVGQLRQALPWYRDPKPPKAKPEDPTDPDPDVHGSVSTGFDERGYYAHIRLPEAQGVIVDQALKAMAEDLKRQARAAASAGSDPHPVYAADALVALAETALQAGEAARPGTDRYLVHVHLEAGPNGIELMTHLGIPLPEGQRRQILCDAKLRGLVHDGATPLGAGRVTRVINRRLRRAIEHRDRCCCAVPGCGRTAGLEIHHIVHWEDGGVTESWNLIALCAFHHTRHHQGTLGIEGNADLPRHSAPGVVFTNAWGRPLDPVGTPTPPAPRPGDEPQHRVPNAAAALDITPHHYDGPTGEKLDRWGFHIQADPPDPFDAGPHAAASDSDDADDLPPAVTGHRPGTAPPWPDGPTGDAPIDPTRAGPDQD